ncbi:dTDP-4-dehydrorhamnose reductase [Seonamhaeicola aphaedonensis]|uniref:dTDP-4-dehydrorhamnose reductase n=1 Tax=Seonamhaeicola aphaedonensis TaxID=1461338 RepID=A0A3D9HHG1_9FLAO|nr:dTDP-4-dehydrorhamnose reductase [Seonamhaeicola aphaedonensis]RED48949.1 dTDP-4-dehydrorhamnose reductase [Seonamhaeicola aphaedonensis]
MRNNVLVTGAGGQLGKTIQDLQSEKKNDIDFTFLSKAALDITNIDDLQACFASNNFNFCINCAAYTNVEQAEITPEIAYKINAESVKNLAEVCKKHNVILIHISTDYVFDGTKRTPYITKDIPNPMNEYGKSKLLGEQYIARILKKYFIIRSSWLYSREYGHNFYRSILNKVKTEKEISVTTDQIGCPTDVVNLSRFLFDLILDKQKPYGLYHFCDKKEMTWYDFAKSILAEKNIKNIKLIQVDHFKTLAKRPKYSVLG